MSVTPEDFKSRVKLRIRTDREQGIVTAAIDIVVGGETLANTIEVAVFNIAAFDLDRGIYDAFVALCQRALQAFTADICKHAGGGVKSDLKVYRSKPKDMN